MLSDTAQFQYKVDNLYCPESEATLRFDDPDVAVAWPIPPAENNLSPKDLRGLPLAEIASLVTAF